MRLPNIPSLLCGWLITSCPPNSQLKTPGRVLRRQGWSWAEQRRDDRGNNNQLGVNNQGDKILLGEFVSSPSNFIQYSHDYDADSNHHTQLSDTVLQGVFVETSENSDNTLQGVEKVQHEPPGDEDYEEMYTGEGTFSYSEYSQLGNKIIGKGLKLKLKMT